MTESIIKQYMAKNRLTAGAVARAAGLANSSIQRQVNTGFDNVSIRTVKLLANVLDKPVQDVFNDLYELAGGINDYDEFASGIYTDMTYTVNDGSLTPLTEGAENQYNLHQVLDEVESTFSRGVVENQHVDFSGGIPDDDDQVTNFVNVMVYHDRIEFEFDSRDDGFKAMWREAMRQRFPEAVER